MDESRRVIKVLVIDDSIDYCNVVKERLEDPSTGRYHVEIVYRGYEGLDKMKSYKPDIVLLDAMMPVIDGYEVLKKIRGMDEGKYMPVIMVSAKSSRADVVKALSLGADDYLIKPFKFEILTEKIGRVIGRRRGLSDDDLNIR